MNIITALLNRASVTAERVEKWLSGSVFPDATINPQDRIGDPLNGLDAETVHWDYRRRVNRGEFTIPTWALWNASQVLPIIGDKMGFWAASIGGMDWDVRMADTVKDNPTMKGRADAQAETLRRAYEAHNVADAVKHLALARFYGFSVLARKTPLEPIDWWNVIRQGLHGAYFYNRDARVTTYTTMTPEDVMKPEDYIIRECLDNMLLACLRAYVRAVDVEDWWDTNLESESRRQVVLLTARPPKGEADNYEAAARNIAAGRSGYIASGTTDNKTEVVFPPASRGLVYYHERLKQIDESLTKLLTGSQLTMLTAPGSGTLAGNAHEKTASAVIAAEAAQVSEVLQEQFDRPALKKAGLLADGENPLAYFSLRINKAVDPDKEIAWTAQLATAGIRRNVVELGERIGMDLQAGPMALPGSGFGATPQAPGSSAGSGAGTAGAETVAETALNGAQITSLVDILSQAARGEIPEASVQPIIEAAFPSIPTATVAKIIGPLRGFKAATEPAKGAALEIPNRAPAESVAAALAVPPEWLAPVRERIDALAQKLPGMGQEEASAEIQKLIDTLPELFDQMDVDSLAGVLEKAMLDAVKKGG